MAGHPRPAEFARHLRTGLREGRRFVGRHAWALALLFGGLLLPIWVFSELADEIQEAEAIVFDEPLLRFAAAVARDGFDRVFLFFSQIGYAWGVVPVDIALVLALLALRHYRAGIFAAIALGGAGLLNLAAKQAFARERPTLWESIAPEQTYSFPSGHAMGSAALALTLVLLAWPTRWRWPVFAAMAVFVPMVGLSRIYLGVHYPSDIVAGWAAASIWVVGVYLMTFRRRTPFARH
ncbi:phosphatase PAP2 family protein [Luteimonas sp. RD2P54]|uniref:undecaprenyl-diphosphate phosphatase n=1 Tax=Luteimonas endophytica TaxID=3042023 RepID=A0ABT6J4S1_9GAMM|nr:phosphatase PAP2 family protein [Luteimonas endophytica]MDH5821615.1 phosphatase PAP2 family protein [Luteimonas endophytica]